MVLGGIDARITSLHADLEILRRAVREVNGEHKSLRNSIQTLWGSRAVGRLYGTVVFLLAGMASHKCPFIGKNFKLPR